MGIWCLERLAKPHCFPGTPSPFSNDSKISLFSPFSAASSAERLSRERRPLVCARCLCTHTRSHHIPECQWGWGLPLRLPGTVIPVTSPLCLLSFPLIGSHPEMGGTLGTQTMSHSLPL